MQTPPTTFKGLVKFVVDFINILIPAIFGLVFLYLVWKVIDAWIIHADDPKKVDEGKKLATTAVIVFVIMVSVWGIVNLIKQSIFG
jgi:hypothetical protein